jgi:hypothetical protein
MEAAMLRCALCSDTGLRMQYVLHPRRMAADGNVLTLKPEPLSREQFDELKQRLPTSPLEWKPGMEGVLAVQSRPCVCRQVAKKIKAAKPRRRRQRAKNIEPQEGYWWNR